MPSCDFMIESIAKPGSASPDGNDPPMPNESQNGITIGWRGAGGAAYCGGGRPPYEGGGCGGCGGARYCGGCAGGAARFGVETEPSEYSMRLTSLRERRRVVPSGSWMLTPCGLSSTTVPTRRPPLVV